MVAIGRNVLFYQYSRKQDGSCGWRFQQPFGWWIIYGKLHNKKIKRWQHQNKLRKKTISRISSWNFGSISSEITLLMSSGKWKMRWISKPMAFARIFGKIRWSKIIVMKSENDFAHRKKRQEKTQEMAKIIRRMINADVWRHY